MLYIYMNQASGEEVPYLLQQDTIDIQGWLVTIEDVANICRLWDAAPEFIR